MRLSLVLLVAMALGCATAAPRTKTGPRLAAHGEPSQAPPRVPLDHLLDPDAPWGGGPSTLDEPAILRITVAQIGERYYDPAAADGKRMFDAILDAWVQGSGGALKREGRELVIGRSRRALDPVEAVWQIPIRVQAASGFLLRELPEGNPLKRGFVAEFVAVDAMLATLTPYDTLVLPDVWRKNAAPPEAKPEGLPAGIVYFKPGPFAPPVVDAMRAGLEKAQAVILDLRGHRGGPPDATADVADLFLSSGPIFTANERDASRQFDAQDDGLASERAKIVVLVDSRTAAGAEVVAQSLRLAGRAILLGESTAGCGLLQILFNYLPGGHQELRVGVRLTVAEAFLGGQPFQGKPFAPDVSQAEDPVGAAVRILQAAAGASRADLLTAAKR